MKQNLKIAALSVALFPLATPSFAGDDNAAKANTPASSTFNLMDYTQFKMSNGTTGKANALIQAWSVGNDTSSPNDQNFRLRRAEFKFSGVVANAPKYFVMVDPAKLIVPPHGKPVSTDNMIQDFGLTYGFAPGFEITAGQFKTPTTAEGLDPAGDLPLPERSLIGRTAGDKREMGVRIAYKAEKWNAATMVSSGRSVSVKGQGMFNDLIARAEITPTKNIGIGSFVLAGNKFDYSKKGRYGFNGRYTLDKAVFRAEFAHGKDAAVHFQGITTEMGYWINDNLEPVVRYESYSPNQAFTSSGQAETIGFNYYFRDYFTKLQVAASALQNMSAVNGSPTIANGANHKEVTVALQVAI